MKSKIIRRSARLISNFLVPPTFLLITFTFIAINFESCLKILINIFNSLLFGFLLPIIVFIILRRMGLVRDIDATIKDERTTPYLIGLFLSILALFISYYFVLNILTIALWVVYTVLFLPLLIINKYWKISAHAIGASVPAALFFYLDNLFYLFFFAILLLVGLSRIVLEKHTPSQVIGGSLLSLSTTFFILKLIAG